MGYLTLERLAKAMTRKGSTTKRWIPIFAILLLVIAGCGGGAADTDEGPVNTVNNLIQAVEDEEFARVSDFACEAQRAEVAEMFDIGGLIGASMAGTDIDPQMVLDAMSFEFVDPVVEELSRDGNAATVRLESLLDISVDEDQFREVVLQLLEEQGMEEPPESVVDQVMEQATAQFEELDQQVDEEFQLVRENDEWLICDQ